MKKYLIGMALILFSPFIQAFDTAELAQMLQQPQNVQGAFAQQRYLKSLNQPMNTGGRFVLLPKKGLLWGLSKAALTFLVTNPFGWAILAVVALMLLWRNWDKVKAALINGSKS